MGLALLRWEEGATFSFDLGTVNRYFTWAVGDGRIRRTDGPPVLADPHVAADGVLGPLPARALGRSRLTLPPGALDREHRAVQLVSFRTEQRDGPAVSEVVQVPLGTATSGDLADLPVLSLGGAAMTPSPATPKRAAAPTAIGLSEAMFLEGLVRLLPQALPVLRPLLDPVASAIGSSIGRLLGSTIRLPSADQLAPLLEAGIPDATTRQQVAALVEQALRAASAATPATQPAPPSPGSTDGTSPSSRVSARSLSAGPHSEALVAPALLAALPALLPVLQQVLNPQTVQAVLNAPNQHLQTITNGIRDFARLGLESAEQDLRHLRAIHPSVDDPALDQLLAGLSLGLSQPTGEMGFRRAASVRLAFTGTTTTMLAGAPTLAYAAGRELAFPVDVATPKAIPQAVLEVCVKDATTLAVRFRRRWRVEQVGAGPLGQVPTVPASIATAGADLLVTVSLAWRTRRGDRRGSSVQQRILVVAELAFDRVEPSSAPAVALSDPSRYRGLWHQVWQGELPDGSSRMGVELVYRYRGRPEGDTERRPTRTRSSGAGRDTLLELRSGMALTPDGLHRLANALGMPALAAAQLEALSDPRFLTMLEVRGVHRTDVRGRNGSGVALHVYPEIRPEGIVLQRATGVSPHGNVTGFTEERVELPLPIRLHVVVTQEGRGADGAAGPDGASLGGLPATLDGRPVVSVTPVPLAPDPPAPRRSRPHRREARTR